MIKNKWSSYESISGQKMYNASSTKSFVGYPKSSGLHDIELEHESCGTGFIANIKQDESYELTQDAIKMLLAMDHRGGRNADPETGDGVGITFSIPHEYFRQELKLLAIDLPERGSYGVGNVFLPQNDNERIKSQQIFEEVCKKEQLSVLVWRPLKVHSHSIGIEAQACEPVTVQVFVIPEKGDASNLAKKLYLARKRATHAYNSLTEVKELSYICSLSHRTVVYKGMLTPQQLAKYYDDLQNENFKTYLGMMHSRFSTNTFPSWERAQPFRMMSHNGEINTIYGNIAKMYARQGTMKSDIYQERLTDLYPIIEPDMSDSASFDNTLEFLYHNGYSLPEVLSMMIPEAWQHHKHMDEKRRYMYEAYSCIMDPWDGPACITFTDGRYVGVVIDRNGLRPSRYYVTNDDRVIMASEFGVLEIDQTKVIKKDRLQAGKIFLLDTEEHRIIDDSEIKEELCNKQDYIQWIKSERILFDDLHTSTDYTQNLPLDDVERLGRSYGYSEEDKFFLIKPMIELKKEPIGSMGNDVSLACLSEKPRPLYDYFKQWFAQVTNPPIDSIRERNIMSIGSYIGPEGNLLKLEPKHTHRLWLEHPILSPQEFFKLEHIDYKDWKSKKIDITYQKHSGAEGLQQALKRIKDEAEQATKAGIELIILTDRAVSKDRVAMSSLMATSTVHHHLVDTCLRAKAAIIVESGEPREVHHYCMLIGYGCDAIYPYLVWEYAHFLLINGYLEDTIKNFEDVISSYKKATDYGICKVFAKMGISTIDSYKGAQIFEAVGIGKDIIDYCFQGTISRIGGIGFEEIDKEINLLHDRGFADDSTPMFGEDIINLGNYQWRSGGYKHMWDPESVALLQHAVRFNKRESFTTFSNRQNARAGEQSTIRALLKIKSTESRIPIEEVESVESILTRFASGAMSFGSISLETHETLAIAMNRIGAKSNSGEGGEISERYKALENGDSKRSAIKQVASGRFGVTIEYLTNATELQIKMAQGAKPGEGGELPGKKVFGQIASTRHSTPGIGLVSPPPHHDIYSIEDLAQLIFDLKNANPKARISVKLVSKAGVGVIAAGVTKAKAGHILISGQDGGTGASPLTSIKHAGLPWELGISETHQVLVRNNLRSRVVLQTDGQIKTGRDVCIAAMLGAEEFGFATSTLIAMGCIMMRKCETNLCPVGVATQDEELRKKFAGQPEHVIRFLTFVAEEVREIMAELGFRKFEDMVGRVDLLEKDETVLNWKSQSVSLDQVLGKDLSAIENLQQCCSIPQNYGLSDVLDQKLLKDCLTFVENKTKARFEYNIKNTDRVTGAILSHEIAKRYGLKGLEEDSIDLHFTGHSGQSFGAFLAHGVSMTVEGDGNDYTGKGLSGGILAFVPPIHKIFDEDKNIIVGSVVLYGAIAGKAFFRGRAAERFCIRNSGARVVVEGLGMHGCEYMTGGRVVVLGTVDENFASGMSGGIAFVWDKDKSLDLNLNKSDVVTMKLNEYDISELKTLIQEHVERTSSERAQYILNNWQEELQHFVKVVSPEYQRIIDLQRKNVRKEVA